MQPNQGSPLKELAMQLGMVGLGRMGANMTRRLMRGGHTMVVSDLSADAVKGLAGEGAVASSSLDDLVGKLTAPRAAWIMVPSGDPTEKTVQALLAQNAAGRHHHRRRQFVFQGRRSPLEDLRRQGRALRRRRHQRRRLGTGARILHDDWRSERGRPAPRPDLQNAGAGTRRHSAHSGTRKNGGSGCFDCRRRLHPLRPVRLRTFRQDGPQRHRVRT